MPGWLPPVLASAYLFGIFPVGRALAPEPKTDFDRLLAVVRALLWPVYATAILLVVALFTFGDLLTKEK